MWNICNHSQVFVYRLNLQGNHHKITKNGKIVKNFQGQNTDIPSYLFHSKKLSLTHKLEKINKIKISFQHSFIRLKTYLSELKNLTCDVYSVVSGSNMCRKTVLLCKKNIISNLVLFFNLRQCWFMLRAGDSIRALLGRPSLPTLVIFQSGIAPC